MTISTDTTTRVARINGKALHTPDATLASDELRQRACTELLRQAAQGHGVSV